MGFRFSLAVVVSLLAASAPAQEITATLSGSVLDSSGAVVPNAAVTVVNAATQVLAWKGAMNQSGVYSAPALPVGRYNRGSASSRRRRPRSAR